MGSAAVIGDERSWGSTGEQVDEDAEREGEQALGDPLDEPGEGLGEVIVEAHLALEVGKAGFDDEPDARLGELRRRALARLWRWGVMSWTSMSSIVFWYSRPQRPLSQKSRLPGSASAQVGSYSLWPAGTRS